MVQQEASDNFTTLRVWNPLPASLSENYAPSLFFVVVVFFVVFFLFFFVVFWGGRERERENITCSICDSGWVFQSYHYYI